MRATRSHRSDEFGRRLQRKGDEFGIESRIVAEHADHGAIVDLRRLEPDGRPGDDDFGPRKSLGRREERAWVAEGDAVSEHLRRRRQRRRELHCAEHDQVAADRCTLGEARAHVEVTLFPKRFDEILGEELHVDAQLSAAGEPDRERRLVAHAVLDRLRDAIGKHEFAGLDHSALDTSARNTADHGCAVEGHRGADGARSAAVDGYRGGHGQSAPRGDGGEQAVCDLEHDFRIAYAHHGAVTAGCAAASRLFAPHIPCGAEGLRDCGVMRRTHANERKSPC